MNVCFLPIPLGRQVRFTTAQQGGSGGKKVQETNLWRLRWREGGSPGVKADLSPAARGSFGRSRGGAGVCVLPVKRDHSGTDSHHGAPTPEQGDVSWRKCSQGKPTQEEVLLMGSVACGRPLLEQGMCEEEGAPERECHGLATAPRSSSPCATLWGGNEGMRSRLGKKGLSWAGRLFKHKLICNKFFPWACLAHGGNQ